ncbi:MAG: glycosyltransferase family 2 protein [Methylobacterium mesophilicum]|nr:glycosyltransferase family 2 protein [Methylobacterium mesophilicum]
MKAVDASDGARPTGHSPFSARRGLSVVIVAYNSGEVLGGLLDSLPAGLEGTGDPDVIVADNDSRDQSAEIALFHPIRPRLLRMGRNAGYAAAINEAARLAGPGRDLLILNPDIRLMPGAARALQARLSDKSIGVSVPRIMHEDGTTAPSLRRDPSVLTAWSEALIGGRLAGSLGLGEIIRDPARYERSCHVSWATGAALMVSAQARAQVGDWDESYFLYSEEVDFMRRVRAAGMAIEYVPQAKAVHIGGEYRSNPFLSGLLTANRIRDYGRVHGPAATLLFRSAIALGAALRAPLGRVHRASLAAALQASTPCGPQRAV